MAGIQEARCLAFCTAVKETIFIAGGIGSAGNDLQTCEVYSTLTNEWQFMVSMTVPCLMGSMVYVAEKIFVLGGYSKPGYVQDENNVVECCDCKSNKWKMTTSIPFEGIATRSISNSLKACPAKLFKDIINNLPLSESPQTTKSNSSHVCVIT